MIETYFRPYSMDEEPKLKKEEELIKDKNCIGCQHIVGCKGKPRKVELCINYEVRHDQEKK